MILLNCTAFGADRVALVKSTKTTDDAQAANQALDDIFDAMNSAYIANNARVPLDLAGFMKLDFKKNEDLDDYVR